MNDPFSSQSRPGGEAQRVIADALGEPGQRRFRIAAIVNYETYIMWMEKQQVAALGLGIAQLLEHMPASAIPYWDTGEFVIDEQTRNQFRVGRLELAYDTAEEFVVIAAHDIEEDDMSSPPMLTLRLGRGMAEALAEQASDVVSRGRPICPMCGNPKAPGQPHVCPEQNGHLPLDVDDDFLEL